MASLQTLTLKDLTLVAEEQAAARLEAACRSRVVIFSHETCGDCCFNRYLPRKIL